MEIKAYCDAKEITVTGETVPNPILMFDEATFPGRLSVQVVGYTWLLIILTFNFIWKTNST